MIPVFILWYALNGNFSPATLVKVNDGELHTMEECTTLIADIKKRENDNHFTPTYAKWLFCKAAPLPAAVVPKR